MPTLEGAGIGMAAPTPLPLVGAALEFAFSGAEGLVSKHRKSAVSSRQVQAFGQGQEPQPPCDVSRDGRARLTGRMPVCRSPLPPTSAIHGVRFVASKWARREKDGNGTTSFRCSPNPNWRTPPRQFSDREALARRPSRFAISPSQRPPRGQRQRPIQCSSPRDRLECEG
jgi:hypothetical protein